MKKLSYCSCLALCFLLSACGTKTVPIISEEVQKINYEDSLQHILHQPTISLGKSQYVINEVVERSVGVCGVPLKEEENVGGFGVIMVPTYDDIVKNGCTCLNRFVSSYEPMSRFCETKKLGDIQVISFLAKETAHEWLSSFGKHTYLFTPEKAYSIDAIYGGSDAESDMFGTKIATMIADFNKQNPQYDFPGPTWKKLNDMVEKALNEEVSNPNSAVLTEMFANLQNNTSKFLDFLEAPAHIYAKTLADICATLPQRTDEPWKNPTIRGFYGADSMIEEMRIDGISGTTIVGDGIRLNQKNPYVIYQYATNDRNIYYFQKHITGETLLEFHEYNCETQKDTITHPDSLITTSEIIPWSRNTIVKIFPEWLILSVSDKEDNQWYYAYDFEKKALRWLDSFSLLDFTKKDTNPDNDETDSDKCFFQPVTFFRVLIRCSESLKNPNYTGPILDRYYKYDSIKNTMESMTQEQFFDFLRAEYIYSPRG